MKVAAYVVNLERAVVRRATMKKELEAAGIEATFLPGIDLKKVGKEFLLKRFDRFGPWGGCPTGTCHVVPATCKSGNIF